MAIEGLTQTQSDFVERFLKVPAIFKRKQMMERRAAAVEQFRLFNAEKDLLRQNIQTLNDPAIKSVFLAQLAVASAVVERDPKNFDFAGGHQQLADVETALMLHIKMADAKNAFGQLEKTISRMDAEHPLVAADGASDAQSDIMLTWRYVQEKMAKGTSQNSLPDIEAALKAMGRLEVMVRNAEKAAQNPFEALVAEHEGVKDAALAGLQADVQAARGRLLDVFNQLDALREKLKVQFGEDSIPLELQLSMSTLQRKLDDAVDASPANLPGIADDAEADLAVVRRDGEKLIEEARQWAQDKAAFLVRYNVMKSHPRRTNKKYVKPKFEEVTVAYQACLDRADAHAYGAACADLVAVRNTLKDALDFADDFALFVALRRERAAELGTLPDPASYSIPALQQAHSDAHDMLTQATTAYKQRQMANALALLNRIPAAVADIKEQNRFATEFETYDAIWQRRHKRLTKAPDPVKALMEDEIAYSAKGGKDAQDDAAAGQYRRASGKMLAMIDYIDRALKARTFLKEYLEETDELANRLAAVKALDVHRGGRAVKSYADELQGDEDKRASAHATKDYRLANAMCLRLKDAHAGMMDLAREAEAYFVAKDLFDAQLAELSGETSADARDAKETAEAMRDNAIAATVRGNWVAAENLMQNATLEIKRAVSDAKLAELLDGMQDAEKGFELTSASEFGPVYASFTKLLQHVSGLDMINMFDEDLAAADARAQSAEALMTSDLGKAETTLNAAVAEVREVAFKLSASESYGQQRTLTKALVKQADDDNDGGVIDTEVAEAKAALQAAEAAADTPPHDFATAVRSLAQAQERARKGIDAMQAHASTVGQARTKMEAAIADYRDAKMGGYLDEHAVRLEEILTRMTAAFDARRLGEAIAEADKGLALAAAHTELCTKCEEAVAFVDYPWLSDLGIEENHALTVDEMAEFRTLLQNARDALAAGSFTVALNVGHQAYWVMMGAREKAEAFDLYLPQRIAAEKALTDLEARSVPAAGGAHEAVQALRARFDGAAEKEALANYTGATTALEGFADACADAAQQLDVYDQYVLMQTRAREALERVRQLKSPAIETLMVRLENKDQNAERKGQAFDFVVGSELYTELKDECDAAVGTAQTIDDFATEATLIKAIAEDDTDDLKAAIAKARAKLQELLDQPSALYVFEEMRAARKLLDSAETKAEEDFAAARVELEGVIDQCVEMALLMAQYDQLNEAAEVARTLGATLLAQTPQVDPFKEEIDGKLVLLETAMNAARASKSNRAQTQTEVEATISAFRDLRRAVDAHKSYLDGRAPVEKRLLKLEKRKTRHLIREDIAEVRRMLATAETRAADRNHKEAMAQLKAANLQIDIALLRGKLASNKKPKKKDIKAILDAPDGSDKLDEIIDNLEQSVQREVMAVAFEVRFGCALEMLKPGAPDPSAGPDDEPPTEPEDRMDLPALNIRQFYKEMAKLPPTNTLDNDSMVIFSHLSGEQTGSAYSPSSKTVLMREGDEEQSYIYAIATAHEIGVLDDTAIPKPGQEMTAFSWNTLHEVGHAVDDKLGYMKKHGERLAGWKTYGSNVKEPSEAIAGHFDFDPAYVAEYMLSPKGKDLPMPKPDGCDVAEWSRRMQECRLFVDRAREGNSPWSSASIAAACAIGDYTYVESYEGTWCRYRTAERKFAVSGYQFRAPGEWFSELYAAMCTDRLNDQHPHRDEIKALCMKVSG